LTLLRHQVAAYSVGLSMEEGEVEDGWKMLPPPRLQRQQQPQ